MIELAVAVVIGECVHRHRECDRRERHQPGDRGAVQSGVAPATSLAVDILTTSGGSATIVFGAVIAAAINFLLVALVVYFCLIVPINALQKVRLRKHEEEPAADVPPTETELLTEIRDLLKVQRTSAANLRLRSITR